MFEHHILSCYGCLNDILSFKNGLTPFLMLLASDWPKKMKAGSDFRRREVGLPRRTSFLVDQAAFERNPSVRQVEPSVEKQPTKPSTYIGGNAVGMFCVAF